MTTAATTRPIFEKLLDLRKSKIYNVFFLFMQLPRERDLGANK